MAGAKTCSKCGVTKPLGEFYKNRAMALGVASRCRICTYKKVDRRKVYQSRFWRHKEGSTIREVQCRTCQQWLAQVEFEKGRVKCKRCVGLEGRIATLASDGRFDKIVIQRARNREKHRKWADRMRAAGLCLTCGQHPVAEKSRCEDCRRKRREGYEAGQIAREAKKQCKACKVQLTGHYVYCSNCRERLKTAKKQRQRDLLPRLLAMYGAFCVCCGEENEAFLTADHMNNDGHKERKESGKRTIGYKKYLKKRRDDIQILCYNCNCGKERYRGTCPHKVLASGDTFNILIPDEAKEYQVIG